ncbi:MAG: hypothetical protein K9L32_00420 [Chromatiaceae bacterium]|nr:hypothetical protein [Chromatiaceae bacterium]
MAGKIETAIADALTQMHPHDHLTTTALCMRVYGVTKRKIEKKHRVSVLRAMRRLVEREPRYVLDQSLDTGEVQLFDGTNPEAWLRADHPRLEWNRLLELYGDELKEGSRPWAKAERHKAKISGDNARMAELDQEADKRANALMAGIGASLRGEPPPEELLSQAGNLLYRWFEQTGKAEARIKLESTGELILIQRT